MALRIGGKLARANEAPLYTTNFVGVNESEFVLPFPGVDYASVHNVLHLILKAQELNARQLLFHMPIRCQGARPVITGLAPEEGGLLEEENRG